MMTVDDLKTLKKFELLQVGLDAYLAMRADPNYVCDMKTFHNPNIDDKTHCCFAGSLIRMLKADPSYFHEGLGQDYWPYVHTVELLRMGYLRAVFGHISDKTYKTIFKSEHLDITPHPVSESKFLDGIREAIEVMKKVGL